MIRKLVEDKTCCIATYTFATYKARYVEKGRGKGVSRFRRSKISAMIAILRATPDSCGWNGVRLRDDLLC